MIFVWFVRYIFDLCLLKAKKIHLIIPSFQLAEAAQTTMHTTKSCLRLCRLNFKDFLVVIMSNMKKKVYYHKKKVSL